MFQLLSNIQRTNEIEGNESYFEKRYSKNIMVDGRLPFVRSTLFMFPMIEFGSYVFIYTYAMCFCDGGRGCRTFSHRYRRFISVCMHLLHAHVRTYSSRSRYGRAVGPLENIADSLDTMP